MSELVFLILRFGFLALLWIFIMSIVYAMRSDLFGAPARKIPRSADPLEHAAAPADPIQALGGGVALSSAPQPASAESDFVSAGAAAAATKLMITSGAANGTEIILEDPILTIGRSPDSILAIVDEYTSTHHARLERRGDEWWLADLDSTNGTRVAGQKITGSVPLPIFTPVAIGKTTFELRP